MKTFWKAFWCTGAVIFVFFLAMYMRSPEAMGIHSIPPNAVVIEGEAVVINYDATIAEWDKAFAKWQELRKKEVK
jgi:hypothetical protein